MPRTIFEKSDAIILVAEVFRELGYEGASMSNITARTKLSTGSLYHFFPGGKEEMAPIQTWRMTFEIGRETMATPPSHRCFRFSAR